MEHETEKFVSAMKAGLVYHGQFDTQVTHTRKELLDVYAFGPFAMQDPQAAPFIVFACKYGTAKIDPTTKPTVMEFVRQGLPIGLGGHLLLLLKSIPNRGSETGQVPLLTHN